MTDQARNWNQVKRQGWGLVKTRMGRIRHFALMNPQGERVVSMVSDGYYPIQVVFEWATQKVAELTQGKP